MTGAIFTEQLKQSWRHILYWGGGLAFLSFYMFAINQEETMASSYADLLGMFPPAFLSGLGVSPDVLANFSVENFIAFGALTYGNIITAVFAVAAGINIIASEEDTGSINVLLALPIPRWKVIVEKYLAYTLILIAIIALAYLGLLGGSMVVPQEISQQVDMSKLFVGTVNMIPAGLSIMAITIFITSLFSRKGISMGVASGFVAVSYVMSVMGEMVAEDSPGRILGNLSIWTYFDAQKVMQNGLQAANVALLLGLALVCLVLAVFAFERRDVEG